MEQKTFEPAYHPGVTDETSNRKFPSLPVIPFDLTGQIQKTAEEIHREGVVHYETSIPLLMEEMVKTKIGINHDRII